jgi:hypothetical protein
LLVQVLMQAIARQTQHAGQVTLTISGTHGEQHKVRQAYLRTPVSWRSCVKLRSSWNPVQRWYRISEVLKRYLKGRQLDAPLRLASARAARGGCGRQHIRGTTHHQLPDLG